MAVPPAEDREEQKPQAPEQLAGDLGKVEEPGAAPKELVQSVCVPEAAETALTRSLEDTPEGAPEGPLKTEKKEGAGGKASAAKSSGTPQDSDSSATCSADEVDEPEGSDKGR